MQMASGCGVVGDARSIEIATYGISLRIDKSISTKSAAFFSSSHACVASPAACRSLAPLASSHGGGVGCCCALSRSSARPSRRSNGSPEEAAAAFSRWCSTQVYVAFWRLSTGD